jgi:hypothetical protein
MESVLFILAGYPGVGKTTLLTMALRQQAPLFGEKYNALFQSTRIPTRFPEWAISAQETLERGTWFSDRHIPYLSTLPELPAHVVLHIDLVTQLTPSPTSSHCPAALIPLLPRTPRSLADEAGNDHVFKHVLSIDFYRRFDCVVINTLYAPWRTIAHQWLARQRAQKLPSGRQGLFTHEGPGMDIHGAIYKSWLRSAAVLEPELMLFSRMEQGRLIMGEIPA